MRLLVQVLDVSGSHESMMTRRFNWKISYQIQISRMESQNKSGSKDVDCMVCFLFTVLQIETKEADQELQKYTGVFKNQSLHWKWKAVIW